LSETVIGPTLDNVILSASEGSQFRNRVQTICYRRTSCVG